MFSNNDTGGNGVNYDTIYGIIIMSNIKTIINRINARPFNSNIKFNELRQYLLYYDFVEKRISSSHHIFISSTGDEFVIPTHNNVVLPVYVKKAYDLVNRMEIEYEKEK